MKNLLYIALTIFALTVISCGNEEITVTGRIVKDCSGTPLSNTILEFDVCKRSGLGGKNFSYFETTTDVDGNFSAKIVKGELEVSANGNQFLTDTYVNGDVKVGTFMAIPSTAFVYRIRVNNPYNLGDTLYLSIPSFTSPRKHVIAAPLKDSTFTLMENYGNIPNYSFNPGTIRVRYNFFVSKNGPLGYDAYFSEFDSFNLPTCPSEIDTITIEIN